MTKEILLLGEFSTGKSAFINMLLGVSLLPERLESTDLPVIKISGNGPAGLWLREQGQKYGRPLDRFKDIPSNWSEFEHAEITIPDHNLLNSGLVIWDTPGINSTHPQHNLHLDNFLKNSSRFRFIYFFLHSNITQSSIDFLKKNTALWDKLIIIVNIKEIRPLEECKIIAKEVKKNVRLKVGNIPVELLYIGDICEEFNYLSASQRNGLSDYELLRQWKERQIDFNSLKDKFLDTIIGEEHIELIEELSNEKIEFIVSDYCQELVKTLEQSSCSSQELFDLVFGDIYFTDDEALKILNEYAERDYIPAQYVIGYLIYLNLLDDPDDSRSFYWLSKAANRGCHNSQAALGLHYRLGIGVQRSSSEAAKWFKSSADGGEVEAKVFLGELYLWGDGVERDTERAFTLFSEAAEQGNEIAMVWLGHYYYYSIWNNEPNFCKAYQYYKNSADKDCFLGRYFLGRCYIDGCGVAKDESKGFAELKKAIETSENIGIIVRLTFSEHLLMEDFGEIAGYYAKCNLYGYGTKIDKEEALKWYKEAADFGNGDAQFWMGMFYEKGELVEKNHEEAFRFYNKSATNKDSYGLWKLGKCYEQGIGTEPDSETAYKWFKESAEKDCSFAQYDLGECYEFGFGTVADERKAIYWYRKAAAQGDEDAQKKLDELT